MKTTHRSSPRKPILLAYGGMSSFVLGIWTLWLFDHLGVVIIQDDWMNLLLGISGSIIASIVVMAVFTLTAERDFAAYVAEAASVRATEEVLKKLSLAPAETYDAADTPNHRFEEKFKRDFSNSSFYCIFGAAADFGADRIRRLAENGALEGKAIKVLVLNPSNDTLLESHARKRISSIRGSAPSLAQEKQNLRSQIISTIEKLAPIARTHDVDVRLHSSFTFFRSEFFEAGFFLTFIKGHQSFPGSAYYQRTSQVYEAYKHHFDHYFDIKEMDFSLKDLARSKLATEEILSMASKKAT